MAVNIATLAIKFVADTSGIKSGVGSVVNQVLTGAAAFLAINRGIAAFTSSAERIDKMSKVADRLGVSFNTIQDAALTAGLAGVELESLTDAIDKMSKNIGSGGMSLDKRFLEQADAIAAIVDPAEQARKAMEVFGKSGAKLLPLLKGGKNAFREAGDFIKRFNLGISDIEAHNVERMNDSWTKMGTIISGNVDKITAELAPAMGVFLDDMIDKLSQVGIEWNVVGDIATKFFAELANMMDLWNSFALDFSATLHDLTAGWLKFVDNIGTNSSTPERQEEIANHLLAKDVDRWQSQKLWNDFKNDASGMRIRDAAEARRLGGGKGKLGAFGGTETLLRGVGAAKDSQEAARIINSGTTTLDAGQKAAIESAKTEREMKRVLEQVRDFWINRPPVVLGTGNI